MKYPRSKALYKRTNRFAENISKLMRFVMVYVSVPGYVEFVQIYFIKINPNVKAITCDLPVCFVVFVLPKAVYSYFMYFTTKLGADAFELPIPTW